MKTEPPSNDAADAQHAPPHLRLAYLLSIYPAISHTFFLNEIAGLRKLGFAIDVASINRPEHACGRASPLEASEAETTFYIKAMNPLRILLVLSSTYFRHPLVILRGLRAALSLAPWNLPAQAYALLYLAEALLFGDWLRRRGHRHLHIHFGGPVATVGMLAAIAWQLSYSVMIHGPEEFYDVEKFYLRKKVERAQFVLCISEYCRSQVMKVSDPAHWSKLHVVRLGVDLEHFKPAIGSSSKDVLEILCVGRLVPAKGHLILLRAFAILHHKGHKVRLRLIGDGPERNALQSAVALEELEDCVILDGALDHEETRSKLMQADIFVLASFAEGVPVALMEAMALQIPCVSTFVAGIPELIRDGVDGLLVPPSSVHALAVALESLITHPEMRRRFAISGRARVQHLYDLHKNLDTLSQTMRKFLHSGH